jgi:mRNA-degrading endonuclease toxin of MazEF toxin-antitoxin module
MLPGADVAKVRPAVVLASESYLAEHADVIVGLLTTKIPTRITSTDYVLDHWQKAGLRERSCFRAYLVTSHRANVKVIGRLDPAEWQQVQERVRASMALDSQ